MNFYNSGMFWPLKKQYFIYFHDHYMKVSNITSFSAETTLILLKHHKFHVYFTLY